MDPTDEIDEEIRQDTRWIPALLFFLLLTFLVGVIWAMLVIPKRLEQQATLALQDAGLRQDEFRLEFSGRDAQLWTRTGDSAEQRHAVAVLKGIPGIRTVTLRRYSPGVQHAATTQTEAPPPASPEPPLTQPALEPEVADTAVAEARTPHPAPESEGGRSTQEAPGQGHEASATAVVQAPGDRPPEQPQGAVAAPAQSSGARSLASHGVAPEPAPEPPVAETPPSTRDKAEAPLEHHAVAGLEPQVPAPAAPAQGAGSTVPEVAAAPAESAQGGEAADTIEPAGVSAPAGATPGEATPDRPAPAAQGLAEALAQGLPSSDEGGNRPQATPYAATQPTGTSTEPSARQPPGQAETPPGLRPMHDLAESAPPVPAAEQARTDGAQDHRAGPAPGPVPAGGLQTPLRIPTGAAEAPGQNPPDLEKVSSEAGPAAGTAPAQEPGTPARMAAGAPEAMGQNPPGPEAVSSTTGPGDGEQAGEAEPRQALTPAGDGDGAQTGATTQPPPPLTPPSAKPRLEKPLSSSPGGTEPHPGAPAVTSPTQAVTKGPSGPASPAPRPIAPAPVWSDAWQGTLFLAGSTRLTPQGHAIIEELAHTLRTHPELRLGIVAWGEGPPVAPFGPYLGYARALMVKRYLAAMGVDPQRLLVRGYGWRPPYPAGPALERPQIRFTALQGE